MGRKTRSISGDKRGKASPSTIGNAEHVTLKAAKGSRAGGAKAGQFLSTTRSEKNNE